MTPSFPARDVLPARDDAEKKMDRLLHAVWTPEQGERMASGRRIPLTIGGLFAIAAVSLTACNADNTVTGIDPLNSNASLVYAKGGHVQRYQFQSGVLTLYIGDTYHVFDIVLSPCDGSFTGTGYADQNQPLHITETISGELTGGQLSFVAVYTGAAEAAFPNYQWFTVAPGPLAGPITGADNTFPGQFLIFGTLGTLTDASVYSNHGEYVSSQPHGDRSEAAQSCIGKPIVGG
jgi:hypothetical protein